MKVKSIFLSINGECCKAGQGSWTTFVRFVGCSANCNYCDTRYALTGGEEMTPIEIVNKVKQTGETCKRVTITGGEPLEQDFDELCGLMKELKLLGYEISIETNGCHPNKTKKLIENFPNECFVVDYKLPSAGKVFDQMEDEFFKSLPENCFIKFVIEDDLDYAVAINRAILFSQTTEAEVYFSPCGIDNASWLFERMKATNLSVCSKDIGFNFQIHKSIFPNNNWKQEEK